jgi:hypothetical protein
MADPVETKKSVWSNPFVIAMVAHYLVMALVGLCIPNDILKANAWAREFCDLMASIVPQLDRITALGIKPDVNRFYFSVLWATSPALFIVCVGTIWSGRNDPKTSMWTMPLHKALAYVIGFIFVFFWTQQLWTVDPSMRLSKVLFASDLGRSFYAQLIFSWGAVFSVAAVFVWLLGWLTGYIPRNIERQRHG